MIHEKGGSAIHHHQYERTQLFSSKSINAALGVLRLATNASFYRY